jgi:membrane fusion protein, multidrug efflux system
MSDYIQIRPSLPRPPEQKSRKMTRNDTMPIETTHEPYQSEIGRNAEPPTKKGPWIRIIVFLVLAGLVGFVVWRIYDNSKKAQATSRTQAAALLNRPVPVQVVPVVQQPMPIYLTALGTVTPYMTVTVKARVSGQLLPVRFTEGQEVRAGQNIMEVDPKPFQAALDQAKGTLARDQALLNNAHAEAGRYQALFSAGVVSKEQMETYQAAQGQYEGAIVSDKAAIENAQLQLNWCSIQSPVNGRIGLRLVDPGNIITANTTNLVVINQFHPIAVYFTVPESQLHPVLAKLRGSKRLVVDAYNQADTQKLATGYLLTSDNQIDTTTGTAKLKAVFNNTDDALFPNQFVNIHLVMEERREALVIPSAAVQNGVQGSFVWVVDTNEKGDSGTAKIQPIKVGLVQGQMNIIDSGLDAGQKVVVDGADRLRAGSQVIVSQARRGGSGPGGRGAGVGAGPGAGQGAAAGTGRRQTLSNSGSPTETGGNPTGGPNGGRRPNKEQQ